MKWDEYEHCSKDAHRYNSCDCSRCKPKPAPKEKVKVGLLFRFESCWVGVHYSPYNRRFCINLVPFVTVWITLKGGKTPHQEGK